MKPAVAALLALLASPALAAPSYIASGTIDVRTAPNEKASVAGRLRANAPVDAEPAGDGWSRIRFQNALATVDGYVRSVNLSSAPVTFAQAMAQSQAAQTKGNTAAALRWAECAAAIPTLSIDERIRGQKRYQEMAAKAGRPVPAEKMPPLLLGLCLPKEINQPPAGEKYRGILLIQMNDNAEMEALTQTELNQPTLQDRLDKLMPRIENEPWYATLPNEDSTPLPGSVFLGARIDNPKIVVLGRCDSPGAVISNQPLRAVTNQKYDPDRAAVMERFFRLPFGRDALEMVNMSSSTVKSYTFEDIFFRATTPKADFPIGIWGLFRSPSSIAVYQVGTYAGPDSFTSTFANYWTEIRWGSPMRFVFVPYRIQAPQFGAGHRVFVVSIDGDGNTKSVDGLIDISMGAK